MKRIVSIIALTLVMVIALTSCSVVNRVKDFVTGIINPGVELTDEALNAQTLIDFAEGANSAVLFESDGWSNGDVFNVVWKKHNVHYENGIMRLGITEEKATAWVNDVEVEYGYTAGEARTQNYYHYGDYEVSMKPSANPGTASTFFVCTGPYDLKDGVPNAHDEIDIEFLGNDTTHVQFNFFVDGVGGNEYMYDLGFDASEEFHTYGFRWLPDSITWFVDGAPVYKVTTDTSVKAAGNLKVVEKLPSTAGRILTNYWCGNERAWGWMGQYVGDAKDQGTEYQWIKTSAEGAPLNPPVDTPPVDGGDEIDWSSIEAIAPTFETTPEYVVAIDGNKANVTYTDVSGSAYKPVEMDVTEAVAGKNFVHLKVTNNGSETVNVRVNMYDPTLTGNNTATNISATMNGETVRTDLDWGGSFFDIPAGESAELVVNFGVGGVKLQLMIDSSRNDSTLRSGDVTIEDIKFAAVGEVVAPHKCADVDEDGKCDDCGKDMPLPPPPAPADPVSGNLSTVIGGTTVELGGNVTDGYGVHGNEDGSIRVEYTYISTNTYENVWAYVAEVAAGKSEVSLKIKNNGEATAYITVKIEATGAVALMEGKMEIPAGEEHTFNGTFTGAAEKLYFFIDSGWSTETTIHAGEVVISEIAFAGEGEIPHSCKDADGDDICDECGHGMIVPPSLKDEGLQLNFWTSSSDYTTNGNNIKYNGAGNSYSCAGADIASLAAGKTTFTVTITNNGSAASRVRVDIQGTTQIGNHTVLNTSATGGDVWTDMEWGGSSVTVAPGESVTLVVTYDVNTDRGAPTNLVVFVDAARGDGETYNSDITLSGMAFSGEAVTPPEDGGDEPELKLEDVAVNISDLTISTTTDEPIANGITVSAGLAIDSNNKSVDGFDFTKRLKLGGTMKVEDGVVKAGVKFNVDAPATIIVYAISSSSSDSTRTFQLATLTDGALVKVVETDGVPGDAVVKLELTVTEAGEYYLGSTKSGLNIYYLAVVYAKDEPTPEEPKPEEPKVDYTDLYVEFKTENAYSLTTPDTYANNVRVTYADMAQNSWANINIWVEDKSQDCSVFSMKLTNHGAATVSVWVQMKDAAGAELINQNVDIAAGAEQVVYFEYTGTAQMIFFFVDSTHEADAEFNTGDITISELKLGKTVAEEPKPEEPAPVEGEYLSFTGNDCYTLSVPSTEYVNTIGVTYSAVSDNSYQNVNTWIQDKAAGKSSVGLTIKNNGTETVNITVKLENSTSGAAEAKVTLAAGESVNAVLVYDFAPDLLYFFIDSGWAEATATHAGDITISGIHFN